MRNGNPGNGGGNIHFVGVIIVSVIPAQIVKPAYPPSQQYYEKDGIMCFSASPGVGLHDSRLKPDLPWDNGSICADNWIACRIIVVFPFYNKRNL